MIGVIGDAVCVEDAFMTSRLINGAGSVRGEVEWRWVKGVMEVGGEFWVHCCVIFVTVERIWGVRRDESKERRQTTKKS